jgi:WhiB family redox-sensing transcriptional regulator
MTFAICHGKTHLFFPKLAERPQARVRREKLAATLCRVCPVSDECRKYGRENHEYGFWGGEGETERHLAGFALPAVIGVRHREYSQKI